MFAIGTGAKTSSNARMTKLVRVLLASNFVVLLALIGPGSSHELYVKMRRVGVAHIIVGAVQIWVVAATMLATILFIMMLFSRREEFPPRRPTKLDWALFLGWWIVIALCCMYAFMMGLGG